MNKSTKRPQTFFCVLCLVLSLVCAFCLLLPHFHECEGTHCSVCVLISTQKHLLPLAKALFDLILTAVLLSGVIFAIIQLHPSSLVQLKVKLLD